MVAAKFIVAVQWLLATDDNGSGVTGDTVHIGYLVT